MPTLFIDINNLCNLSCKACSRGSGIIPHSSELMPLSLFRKIIHKTVAEKYFNKVGFFNWSEPMLQEDIAEYVRIVKEQKLHCEISTNFSSPVFLQRIDSLLQADIDCIYISLSGHYNETHTINHTGSNIDTVYRNVEYLYESIQRQAKNVTVIIKFLDFGYNSEERFLVQDRLRHTPFEIARIQGVGHPPAEMMIQHFESSQGRHNHGYILPQSCIALCDSLPVDHHGDCFLCCAFPNFAENKIGNYLDLPIHTIMARRISHPRCTQLCDGIECRPYSVDEVNKMCSIENNLLAISPGFSRNFLELSPDMLVSHHEGYFEIPAIRQPISGYCFIRMTFKSTLGDEKIWYKYTTQNGESVQAVLRPVNDADTADPAYIGILEHMDTEAPLFFGGGQLASITIFTPAAYPAQKNIQLNIEQVDREKITGWASAPGTDDRIRVALLDKNGARIFSCLADIHRPDLSDAKMGDGCHAFSISEHLEEAYYISFIHEAGASATRTFFLKYL